MDHVQFPVSPLIPRVDRYEHHLTMLHDESIQTTTNRVIHEFSQDITFMVGFASMRDDGSCSDRRELGPSTFNLCPLALGSERLTGAFPWTILQPGMETALRKLALKYSSQLGHLFKTPPLSEVHPR